MTLLLNCGKDAHFFFYFDCVEICVIVWRLLYYFSEKSLFQLKQIYPSKQRARSVDEVERKIGLL